MGVGHPIRVLLVEDSEHDALALKRVLGSQARDAFELDHVEKGEAALEMLQKKQFSYDVMVLDYNLPGMNGLEAGRELAGHAQSPPLVLLTGEGSEELAVKALKTGFYDYVVKDPRSGYLTLLPAKLAEVARRSKRDREYRQSQERYTRLVENIPAIIYSRSMAYGLSYISSPIQEILGNSPQAYLDDVSLWVNAIHPEDRPKVDEAVAALKELKPFSLEYRIQRGDGKWIWLRDRSFRITQDGEDRIVEGIATDITQEKRHQELKEDFLRVSRHDMRSPLSGIISLSTMMAEEMEGECGKFASAILKSSYRMMDMLNSTVDMYKMEQGMFKVEMKDVDLDKTVNEVVQNIQAQAPFNSREIRINRCGAMVRGDETLCWSVLTNLLKNALEAGGDYDVVRITCAAGRDTAFVEIHNRQAVPAEVREHFFEKYYTHGKRFGFGLGCYSAKLMTETMNGTVSMRTSEEEGTTLKVVLEKA